MSPRLGYRGASAWSTHNDPREARASGKAIGQPVPPAGSPPVALSHRFGSPAHCQLGSETLSGTLAGLLVFPWRCNDFT